MDGEGQVAERLRAAMNARDIEVFVDCFAEEYDSKQPAHPGQGVRGTGQVRENWSAIFDGVPDFSAELVSATADADTEWSEWRWRGTQADGTKLDMAG